ncbi:MAG: gamma-glutamyltranspeptidase/glutathione hydrolase [Alphaproteobacteria bacterium]|jgi:gamma-glutamyltranspeptidase/glutathione hydrolase
MAPISASSRAPFAALALIFALSACAGTPEPTATPSGPPTATPSGSPPTATTDEAGFATDASRKAHKARREMVAAANPLAAQAGLRILRQGGNAIDAAIAIQAMLTLVEPQSSGIGGGGFLMHFDGKTGEIAAYEGREAAPGATTENDFLDADGRQLPRDRTRVGGIATAVPGSLRMLETAHKKHGKLPWRALFAPAIELARAGFKVSPRLHQSIAKDRYLGTYPSARAYFFDAAGQPLAVGATLRNEALAKTLEAIAKNGADAFYTGAIAQDIAATIQGDQARPGKMTVADLKAYKTKKRGQICGPYRTWLVCGFGPPTAGGVTTLMTLALLERFDLSKLGPNSAEAVHLFAEATRLANADRLRYVADPDFVDVPISAMLDLRYLARRSRMIQEKSAMRHASPGKLSTPGRRSFLNAPSEDTEQPSTTHLNVIDKDGNTVAMTASVGHAFGSRLFVRGFILNNHATDFTPVPRTKSGRPKTNRAEGFKRPLSAQSPTLVFDGSGKLVMAVGSPGGTRIIGYVVKTLIAVLDWNMDIQQAISLPNRAVRSDWVELERGTALEDARASLEAMGHKVRLRTLTSGLQGIFIKNGVLTGGADPRREGLVVGN